DFGARGRAEHRGLLVTARRIAVHGADRRLDLLPSVEVVHGLEGRQVVAIGCRDQLSDRFLLRDVEQEILRSLLVFGELPEPVELRQLADEAALWSLRHRMCPAL